MSYICTHPMDIADQVQDIVNVVKNEIGIENVDAVYFTGISGAAIGFPLAVALEKHAIILRKDCSNSHSCNDIECCPDIRFKENVRIVIVDDFIDTGNTINRLCEAALNNFDIIGVCLYKSDHDRKSVDIFQGMYKECFQLPVWEC